MPACRAVSASAAAQARRAQNARTANAQSAGNRRGSQLEIDRRVSAVEAALQIPSTAKAPGPSAEPEKPAGPLARCCRRVLDFLDQTWLQTLQYLVFLFVFQSLTGTIRMRAEFYFDKYLTDTFIENTFDSAHNRFEDVRRVSDIWEWTSNVLVAGIFSNADEGEAWPDGDGPFSLQGATPLSTAEVVDQANTISYTQGIIIKQVRAEPLVDSSTCYANHTCYGSGAEVEGDKSTFGYGPYAGKFVWWSHKDLGANPEGIASASPLSLRQFSSSGFVAAYLPFFSNQSLPDQNGTAAEVLDYRPFEATPSNGRAPNYYCARSTINGFDFVQRCNPNIEANDAIARDMMDQMLTELKRGHWVDHKTRLVTISMQVRNNNGGVRFIVRYMFELTQMGAVLPSYDMETFIDDAQVLDDMRFWMQAALFCTAYFAFLEFIEFAQSGPIDYLGNMWNVMDWINFFLFSQVYLTMTDVLNLNDRDQLAYGQPGTNCVNKLCVEFGFYDLWEVMDASRMGKFYMSICVCIQLLKIIKFTNVIVPKMSLMTSVLAQGAYDLLFFGVIFAVSMFAFCMLFYIQLGAFMDDFYSQPASMIALAKALFGDFPFEEIIDNSRGYLNGLLFLVYLFVAVFILLSMFLAILGEAQAAVPGLADPAPRPSRILHPPLPSLPPLRPPTPSSARPRG